MGFEDSAGRGCQITLGLKPPHGRLILPDHTHNDTREWPIHNKDLMEFTKRMVACLGYANNSMRTNAQDLKVFLNDFTFAATGVKAFEQHGRTMLVVLEGDA